MENWEEIEGKLTEEFTFENFAEALAFVNQVGEIAEELNHHPDIFIYDYKHVMIQIYSHDVQAITEKDEELAAEIDEIV